MNPLYPKTTSTGEVQIAQLPNDWIQTTKETLCKYLSQIDLSKVTLPEFIEVKSIEPASLSEMDLGDDHGKYLTVMNYRPAHYNGFIITFKYENKEYRANVAMVGFKLTIYFPFFQENLDTYCETVSQTMILNLVQRIAHLTNSEITPKEVKILHSRDNFTVMKDTLSERFKAADFLDSTRPRIQAYSIGLSIKDRQYKMIVTKEGNRARNYEHHLISEQTEQQEMSPEIPDESNRPQKRAIFIVEHLEEAPLLNDGMPFII